MYNGLIRLEIESKRKKHTIIKPIKPIYNKEITIIIYWFNRFKK